MNFEEIKAIILVDDRASRYTDGGNGAVPRKNRYKILFSILKEKMKNIENEYLILGDGIFEINDQSEELKKIREEKMFSDNSALEKISNEIQTLSGDKKTLLLIDYRLDNSEKKQDKGKKLSYGIISKLSSKNIIKQLYSTSPKDNENMNDLDLICAFDFPITAPTDAAEEIIQMLEDRGDLNV